MFLQRGAPVVQESEAVDSLFENICAGSLDLRGKLMGDHVELMAPSPANRAACAAGDPVACFTLGPSPTASAGAASRRTVEASGTVFLITRNACSNPVSVHVEQTLTAQLRLPLVDLFALVDTMVVSLAVAAVCGLLCVAMLLCQVWSEGQNRPLKKFDAQSVTDTQESLDAGHCLDSPTLWLMQAVAHKNRELEGEGDYSTRCSENAYQAKLAVVSCSGEKLSDSGGVSRPLLAKERQ
jgi:hypothetical protein